MSKCCCCSSLCCCSSGGGKSCRLSMSTVAPNASIKQTACKSNNCGGASCLSTALNALGKWGTVLLATSQGKPVNASGVAVGAKGASAVGGISTATLLLILAVVGVLIFVALRK